LRDLPPIPNCWINSKYHVTTKRFMILRSLQNLKMQVIVVPAWMAGIQIRKDASGHVHVTWIPALHTGMTPWKGSA
jgi:hypothetical protein